MDLEFVFQATLLSFVISRYVLSYFEISSSYPQYLKLVKYFPLGIFIFMILASLLDIGFIKSAYFPIVSGITLYFINLINARKSQIVWVFLPVFLAGTAQVIIGQFFSNQKGAIWSIFETSNAFALIWMFGFGFYIFRQNRIEQKTRKKEEAERQVLTAQKAELERLVADRTQEISTQKSELEESLKELQSTQAQLIHAEKMASLGELTAGIAHEIQNPLNFVNNFAEISNELIDEMVEALTRGDQQSVKEISGDIQDNLKKITHHGKRADSIVKNMLQHSRKSTGQKEPTNINALADEYLRLSYHGLRGKDKSFNAEFVFTPDPDLPIINVISQDIGRVLLNLINNAFYAVNVKLHEGTAAVNIKLPEGADAVTVDSPKVTASVNSNLEVASQSTENEKIIPDIVTYKPKVTVETRTLKNKTDGDQIEVLIKDNGPGIPAQILDKIFQPFFTTKPTGHGTGLGLSLAYDILKAHQGDLKVKSQEGKGTTFIIHLPVK